MRETTVNFASEIFHQYGLAGTDIRCLEVGGTPEVFFQKDGSKLLSLRQRLRNRLVVRLGGEAKIKHPIAIEANPLLQVFPKLEFLDRGFNEEAIGTDQDHTVDFTIDEQVAPLLDTYDMAISFDTLEHVDKPVDFCRNLLRVVKPGGYVYLQTVFKYQYHPSPEDYYRFSPTGLKECFRDSGGDILECGWDEFDVSSYIFLRRPA